MRRAAQEFGGIGAWTQSEVAKQAMESQLEC